MRYIIEISNVSSQGEQCMMILMVDLVILVMFISNSASVVNRWYKFRGRRSVKFSVFHFPYVGFVNKIHVYTQVPLETKCMLFC